MRVISRSDNPAGFDIWNSPFNVDWSQDLGGGVYKGYPATWVDLFILATLLARLSSRPVVGRDPRPVMILTLRPEGGVWLEVSRA